MSDDLRARLTALVDEMWEADRHGLAANYSLNAKYWADRIAALLREPPERHMRGRCPTCGHETCLKCGEDHRFGADHEFVHA